MWDFWQFFLHPQLRRFAEKLVVGIAALALIGVGYTVYWISLWVRSLF